MLIIIRGPLGVGKTEIAKRLAKKLNGKYISVDEILERNRLDKIQKGRIPLENFIQTNEYIFESIKKLSKNKPIIIDGNFYYKKQMFHLIENSKRKNYIFTLKTPLSVCISRDNKRGKPYGKKAAREVYNLVSKFNFGITIDAKKNTSDIVNEILSMLEK